MRSTTPSTRDRCKASACIASIAVIVVMACGKSGDEAGDPSSTRAPSREPSRDLSGQGSSGGAANARSDAGSLADGGDPISDGGDPSTAGIGQAVVDSCRASLGTLMSHVNRSWLAMEPYASQREAKRLFPLVPEACRDARWYLAGSLLLDLLNGELEADRSGAKLTSADQVLAAALTAKRITGANGENASADGELDVLARVALRSALGHEPKLPDDACARATAGREALVTAAAAAGNPQAEVGERALYVCARAAIVAGDGTGALAALDAINTPAGYVDFDLAKAQAARLAGDAKTAKRHAQRAAKLGEQQAWNKFLTTKDRAALLALAKQLAVAPATRK